MRRTYAVAALLLFAPALTAAEPAPTAPKAVAEPAKPRGQSLLERYRDLTRRADAGESESQRLLADIYMEGTPSEEMDGVFTGGPNYTRARELYEKAAAAGDSKSEVALFRYYNNGMVMRQTPENVQRALEWLKPGIARGDPAIQYEMGNHFWIIGSVPRDVDQALEWYHKSAAQGYGPAMYRLGAIYFEKNDWEKYRHYIDAGAENGDPDAMYFRGYDREWGRFAEQNDDEAAIWYRKAVDAGETRAAVALGWMYYQGRGVAKDDRKAQRLFELATEALRPGGMDALGYLYYGGTTQLAKDYDKAAGYYRMAAAYNHPQAIAFMGRLYARGHGVTKDDMLSHEWTERGALMGVPVAQSDLALIYYHGRGTKKDLISAYAWGSIAAARDEPEAVALIKTLEAEMTAADKEAALVRVGTIMRGWRGSE